MRVKPYSLPGSRILAHYGEGIATLLRDWCEKWQFEGRFERVIDVSRGVDPLPLQPALRLESSAGEAWMVVDAAESLLGGLGAAALERSIPLPDPPPASRLLGELGLQALLELAAELDPGHADYRLARRGPLAECMQHDGLHQDPRCVRVDLVIDGDAFSVWQPWSLAEPRVVDFIDEQIATAPVAPLATPIDSLEREKILAEARLGSAEISLQTLSSMRVGDVLCLDTGLDEPVSLIFARRDGHFAGFLGKQDEHYAIRVESFISA